jgi:two-component system, OmpR family, KDP operon response regulator KdpE
MTKVLRAALQARGYPVRTVATGTEALDAVVDDRPALVVLDLALPDVDGVEVCRRIRAWSDVAIIVVTADGAEDRKVAAFDAGADDYVTKPFSFRELEARVRVGLRRGAAHAVDAPTLQVGDIVVDIPHHWATVGGRLLDLTPKEFELLSLFARNPGRVLTHDALLAHVWGREGAGHVEYLRVYARALRQKLGEDPANPRLVTEPGIGYRLVDRGELPA